MELQRDGSLGSSGGGQGFPLLRGKLVVFYEVVVVVMVQRDAGDGGGQSNVVIVMIIRIDTGDGGGESIELMQQKGWGVY